MKIENIYLRTAIAIILFAAFKGMEAIANGNFDIRQGWNLVIALLIVALTERLVGYPDRI